MQKYYLLSEKEIVVVFAGLLKAPNYSIDQYQKIMEGAHTPAIAFQSLKDALQKGVTTVLRAKKKEDPKLYESAHSKKLAISLILAAFPDSKPFIDGAVFMLTTDDKGEIILAPFSVGPGGNFVDPTMIGNHDQAAFSYRQRRDPFNTLEARCPRLLFESM